MISKMHCATCALIGALLFFALSPGILLTLPPKCKGKVFVALKDDDNGCATSYGSAALHAALFGLILFGVICFVCCRGGTQDAAIGDATTTSPDAV